MGEGRGGGEGGRELLRGRAGNSWKLFLQDGGQRSLKLARAERTERTSISWGLCLGGAAWGSWTALLTMVSWGHFQGSCVCIVGDKDQGPSVSETQEHGPGWGFCKGSGCLTVETDGIPARGRAWGIVSCERRVEPLGLEPDPETTLCEFWGHRSLQSSDQKSLTHPSAVQPPPRVLRPPLPIAQTPRCHCASGVHRPCPTKHPDAQCCSGPGGPAGGPGGRALLSAAGLSS